MGRLKPGANYVYEKADGVTYAREVGAHPSDRFEIGCDYYTDNEPRVLGMPVKHVAVWIDMIREAEHNPALQDALDRAKVIYELSRDHGLETIMHHPV